MAYGTVRKYAPFFLPFLFAAACGSSPGSSEPGDPALALQLSLSGSTLRITARDGQTPVMTDVWLYVQRGEQLAPWGGFSDPDSKRRSRRLLLPCTLGGMPSELTPCDDGSENGLLTDSIRETRMGAATQSAIDGTVEVAMTEPLPGPLVVVAGLEDQRYSGIAAISTDGQPLPMPTVRQPERRPARSHAKDVAPILQRLCQGCHGTGGPAASFPLRTYEDVVNNDFGYTEEKEACEEKFPADLMMRMACEAAITKVEYMIEPGVPALSAFLRRTRPDENRSVSPEGLKWYGSSGQRFGSHGDRRMPPQNITPELTDDQPKPSYFDDTPADYQILYDWVAQGAPR